jgi:signal transduction histidine kinase
MRLNSRLALLCFLITVIPVFVVGILAFQNGRQTIEKNTITHLVSTNLLKKAEFERWVRDNCHLLEILAKNRYLRTTLPDLLQIKQHFPADRMPEYASIMERLNPALAGGGIRELFILRASDGRLMISTDPVQEGKFHDNQPYFINGRNGTYVQNVYYAMSIQQAAMTVGTPLTDLDGNLVAVLAGRLDLAQLSAIMEMRSGLSKSEDTYLVNKFNFYVTEPRFGHGFALKTSIHTEGVIAALADQDGVGFYPNYRGVPVIGAYRWLPEWELALVTEVDQAEAYAPVHALRNVVLGIAMGISILATVLGWLSAYAITTPLRRLAAAAEVIDAGRLDVALETGGRGEVADLARALDRMVKRLASTLVSRDALLSEIGERKKAEQSREQALVDLKRSNEELQQFAYVASHDLQEPLRMVSSYTQLLADRYGDRLDDKARKYIDYAVDGAVRMQRLIQDLLTYSRIATRGGELETINSQSALDEAMVNLQVAIAEAEAAVTHDVLPDIKGDATQLAQLFQNLIGNAVKFRSQATLRIHVAAEKDGDDWRFSVADNGIGIDLRYREKVFEIFQRLHTRSEYPGTGIGLAICKRIVDRHGGKIWFTSEPGQGSIFFFTLKAA